MGIFTRSNEPEPVSKQIPSKKEGTVKDFPVEKVIEKKTSQYGIEDAISLMRNLPEDNIEVVVTVVKKTLESTDIKVAKIIGDAEKKEASIREQVKMLEAEIAKFEASIADRKHKITALKDDLSETTKVKEHLQLAERANKQSAPPVSPETKAEIKPETKKVDPAAIDIKPVSSAEKPQGNVPPPSAAESA